MAKKCEVVRVVIAIFASLLTLDHSNALAVEITATSEVIRERFESTLQRAERGDPNAQNSVGGALAVGEGVTQDAAAAYRWLRKAAEQGHAAAQYNLYLLLRQSPSLGESSEAAMQWLQKATDQGVLPAQFSLAELYRKGREAHENRRERTAMYYLLAAKQGFAAAQFYTGWCYEKGIGVLQNDVESTRWYLKAATQGHVDAQINLAVKYAQGRGVDKSLTQARRWFKRAARQNSAVAQYNLGKLYQRAQGDEVNLVEAYVWVSLAANKGLEAALKEQALLLSLMSDEQIKRAKTLIADRSETLDLNEAHDRQVASRRSVGATKPISGLEAFVPEQAEAFED